MDFITGNIKKLYFQYLFASMGSALVMSIYSFVDTIAVGQSEGPVGTAAMAVITPIYGIIIFLAILCGVGGSVLMTQAKAEGSEEKGNAYFTASLILMGTLIAVSWVIMALFHEPIFRFFGADDETMPKVWAYAKWQVRVWPIFLLPTFISAFIRNDGAPGLAMGAVITGGAVMEVSEDVSGTLRAQEHGHQRWCLRTTASTAGTPGRTRSRPPSPPERGQWETTSRWWPWTRGRWDHLHQGVASRNTPGPPLHVRGRGKPVFQRPHQHHLQPLPGFRSIPSSAIDALLMLSPSRWSSRPPARLRFFKGSIP